MPEQEVGFRLSLKNRREVQHGVNEVGDEFNRVGDQAERAGRKARIAAGGMLAFGRAGRVAGRAVVYGTGAAVAGVVGAGIALTKLSKDSIGEAREAQKVGAITRSEIKATGGAAKISARQVGDLAGAISEKVGIDDEAIQSGSNLLLTFKNVRNEVGRGNKIFNRATRSAVDLSAAGFGSIESGSKMLGKALNDPLKGITALSRAGVTFTKQQQDTIKRLVEEGDLLSAQKMILKEVESQVGGVAEAQATWGDKAAVSWGNIQESLGTALLPLLDRTQRWFVEKGAPALEGYVDIFERKGIPTIRRYAGLFEDRAIPAISDFVDEARPLAESIIPAIGSGLGTAADAFKVIAPRAKAVFDGFNNLPDWAKTAIGLTVGGGALAKKIGVDPFSKGGLGSSIASMAKPLPVYVVNNGVGGTGAPGLLGAGGKTPGGVKVPPILANGWKGLALPFVASTAMTSFSKYGTGPGLGLNPKIDVNSTQFNLMRARNEANSLRDAQAGLNRVFQSGKKTGDDYALSLMGVDRAMDHVDREVRPRVVLDGIEVQEARLDAFRSKLDALDLGVIGGGPPSRPRRPSINRPKLPKGGGGGGGPAGRVMAGAGAPIHVHNYIDGREVSSTVIDRWQTEDARR